MNKKNIIVPFLLISSLAFADIQVDSIKKEKKTTDYSYSITVPNFKLNGKELKDVNGAFENEILTLIKKTKFEGKELSKLGSSAKAETVVDFKKYENSFGVASVVTESYTYTGGANGITVLNSYNLDERNGKILLFDDIFIESAKQSFEKGILQIVKNNNSGKYMSDIENVNLDDAVMYFEGNYIIFKFQKYSIAPGSSGNPAFRYNKEAIKNFIKYDFEN